MIELINGKCYAENGIVCTRAMIYVKTTSTPGPRRSRTSLGYVQRNEIIARVIDVNHHSGDSSHLNLNSG